MERTMTTEYNASEIDRLVREGTEDNERMTPGPWDGGNDWISFPSEKNPDERDFANWCGDVRLSWSDNEAIARTRNNLAATVAALSAAKAEVDKLRGEIAMLLANADADTHLMTDAIRDRDRLAAEVERLTKERDEARNRVLRPLTEDEVVATLHEGHAKRRVAQGDNAWTSLVNQRDRLSARVRELELTEEDREALQTARDAVLDAKIGFHHSDHARKIKPCLSGSHPFAELDNDF